MGQLICTKSRRCLDYRKFKLVCIGYLGVVLFLSLHWLLIMYVIANIIDLQWNLTMNNHPLKCWEVGNGLHTNKCQCNWKGLHFHFTFICISPPSSSCHPPPNCLHMWWNASKQRYHFNFNVHTKGRHSFFIHACMWDADFLNVKIFYNTRFVDDDLFTKRFEIYSNKNAVKCCQLNPFGAFIIIKT